MSVVRKVAILSWEFKASLAPAKCAKVSFDMDGIPGPDSERPRKHTDPGQEGKQGQSEA